MRIGRAMAFRWTLVPIALSYVAGLLLVANLAFGASTFFGQGVSTPPARTGSYDSRLPAVAPVDGQQVARAITEASGGPPTIGLPLPDDSSSTPALTAVAFRSPSAVHWPECQWPSQCPQFRPTESPHPKLISSGAYLLVNGLRGA